MGSLGKKLSRGSLHLLGSNLTVLPQSGGVGVGVGGTAVLCVGRACSAQKHNI